MSRKTNTSRRQPMLAKLHIAKKELGLSDEDYRAMLHGVTGKESAADLTDRQLIQVLDHLAKLGFKAKTKGRPKNMDRKDSRARQLEKIEALLTVGKRPWSYADALAKKICKPRDPETGEFVGDGPERIAWVPDHLLYKVITALRKQGEREGWDLSGERPQLCQVVDIEQLRRP